MTTTEHYVPGAESLADGESVVINVGAIEVGVFRIGNEYRAWRNVCPHAAAPVCLGRVEKMMLTSDVYEYRLDENQLVLRCPWHGWEYDMDTGEHLTNKKIKLKRYPIVERADGIYVVMPNRIRATNSEG